MEIESEAITRELSLCIYLTVVQLNLYVGFLAMGERASSSALTRPCLTTLFILNVGEGFCSHDSLTYHALLMPMGGLPISEYTGRMGGLGKEVERM